MKHHTAPMHSTVPTSPLPLSRSSRLASICSGLIGAESPAPRFSAARRNLGIASCAALSAMGLFALSGSGEGASATWTGSGDGFTWDSTLNWDAAFPNAITDTATFNTGTASVTLGAPITVQNILFSAGAGAFNLGTNGGNGLILRGSGTGGTPSFTNSISIASGVTNPQVIAAPISFSAPSSTAIGCTFKNDSTTTAATLTLSGAITANTATNRATTINLDGANTGNNTVSGVITSTLASGGVQNAVLTKNGAGRWVLSGANVLSGASMTNTGGFQGIQINAGVLSAQNNQAFGTSGTANANQVWINNGGTLELANSITMDNGVSLNLQNGGTIRSSGSTTTQGRVNVGTAASTSVTLSAVGSSDVFTIGNGSDDFAGGSSTSTVNIGGAGTVLLAQSSNYAGGISIGNGSTLRINSDTALGAAASANLTLVGNGKLTIGTTAVRTPTVIGLNSNSATAVVETGFTGTSTLTVNNAAIATSTYAGILQNGTGTLALTKSGLGTLTLSGTNTYTGATLVRGGTLNLDYSAATAPASNIISASSALTLGGGAGGAAGNPGGLLTVTGKGAVANAQTFSTLAIGAGANKITLTPGTSPSAGTVDLTITGAHVVPSNTVHGSLQFSSTGTTRYTNTATLNQFVNGQFNYYATYGMDSWARITANVVGAIAGNDVTTDFTAAGDNNVTASFNTGSGADPNSIRFATGSFTANQNDVNFFTGGILVASTAGASSLATSASGTLRPFGSGTGNQPTDFHIIQNSASDFTLGLPLNNNNNTGPRPASLVKSGSGKLIFTAANGYTGGTYINEGTVQVGANGTTGVLGTGVVVNYGALIFNRSNDLTDSNAISGTGTLMKQGAGTLTLGGASSYTGTTTISAGTLSIAEDNNIGASAAAVSLNGGTLKTTNITALTDTHAITVGASGGMINIAGAATSGQGSRVILSTANTLLGSGALTVSGPTGGVLAGATGTNTTGAGALVLNAANNGTAGYSGNLTLQSGGLLEYAAANALASVATITLGNEGEFAVGSGLTASNNITVSGGTNSVLSFNNGAATISGNVTLNANATVGLRNWYNYAAAQTGTISGVISGSGALTVEPGATAGGVLTLTGTNTYTGATTINSGATLQIGDGTTDGNIAATSNIVDNGALVSNRVGSFSYGNVISGTGTLTKSGAGTQTLTAANSYSGNTNVNAGTLAIAGNHTGNGQLIVNNAGILQFGDGASTNGSSVNSGTIFVNNTGTVAINKTDGGTFANQIASNPSAVTTLQGNNASGTTNTFTGVEYSNGGSFAISSTNAGAILAFFGAAPGAIDLKGTNLTIGGAGDTLFTSAGTGIYSSTTTSNVVKNGIGTLIYQGNQGYTGQTDINAGAVRVDTAQTNGGTYYVGNGGTTTTAASLLVGGGSDGLTGGVTFNRTVSVNAGNSGNRTLGGTNTGGTNIFSGAVTFVGPDSSGQDRSITLTASTGGTVAFNGGLTGGGVNVGQNVTKTGGGTVAIQSTASYFGTTTVSAGTLAVGTSTANGSLNNTTGITVNNGGTLLLGGTSSINRVNDNAGVNLGTTGGTGVGGKLSMEGLSSSTETLASLTLSFNSTLDFGSGNGNQLLFTSGINGLNNGVTGFTLSVWNWSGPIGAGTQDVLALSNTLTETQLSSISFYSDGGSTLLGTGQQISFGTPTYQIVPVPEPTTIFGALALLGLVGYRERRRLAGLCRG